MIDNGDRRILEKSEERSSALSGVAAWRATSVRRTLAISIRKRARPHEIPVPQHEGSLAPILIDKPLHRYRGINNEAGTRGSGMAHASSRSRRSSSAVSERSAESLMRRRRAASKKPPLSSRPRASSRIFPCSASAESPDTRCACLESSCDFVVNASDGKLHHDCTVMPICRQSEVSNDLSQDRAFHLACPQGDRSADSQLGAEEVRERSALVGRTKSQMNGPIFFAMKGRLLLQIRR